MEINGLNTHIPYNENPSDLHLHTEFMDNSYDRPDVLQFLSRVFLNRKTDNRRSVLACLHDARLLDFYSSVFLSDVNNFAKEITLINSTIKKIQTPILELELRDGEDVSRKENGTNQNTAESLLKHFVFTSDRLNNLLTDSEWTFEQFYSDADHYIEAYYELLRKVIFSPANYNLNDMAFRQSRYLRELTSFSAMPLQVSYNKDNLVYKVSLLDPFILDVFLRAFDYAKLLDQSQPKGEKQNLLDLLRIDLYLSSVQSAFSRYAYLNGMTYRVQLNRHTSQLLAIPYDHISSVEEIKPIRLFEKIASYIRNRINQSMPTEKPLCIRVCIIGHTERSGKDKKSCEAGIEDLIGLLLRWYSRLRIDHKPNLNFMLENYVNVNDYSAARDRTISLSLNIEKKDEQVFARKSWPHKFSYLIKAVDYYDYSFSTEKLIERIKENQLVFILDCPWLTAQNYELKKDGSLTAFSQMLSETEYSRYIDKSRFFEQFQAFFKDSMMRQIDGQFGRVLSSNTGSAGQVIRILKEPVLRRIRKQLPIESTEPEKIVYLFTSEKDGVDLSSIASDPLTRTEKYDGKTFTIVKYSNHKAKPLVICDKENVSFKINLWSIVKYISASFAYLELRDSLLKCLSQQKYMRYDFLRDIDIIGVYRSIFVCFLVDELFETVRCSVRISDSFKDCFPSFNLTEEQSEELNHEVLNWARSLVEPLYRNVVFSNTSIHRMDDANQNPDRYGDDAIRTAFLMNLYSCAEDVDTIVFWHKYRMLQRNGNRGNIRCIFKRWIDTEPIPVRDHEFEGVDFFSDKKIYDSMLINLEQGSIFSMAMDTLFDKAEELIEEPERDWNMLTASIPVLNNIINVCFRHGLSHTTIYKNAKKALWESNYYGRNIKRFR